MGWLRPDGSKNAEPARMQISSEKGGRWFDRPGRACRCSRHVFAHRRGGCPSVRRGDQFERAQSRRMIEHVRDDHQFVRPGLRDQRPEAGFDRSRRPDDRARQPLLGLSVFAKTGISRQSELAAMLAGLAFR